MSEEENKDLGDKAKDFANEAKESAKEFADEAKEAASDFKESVQDVVNSGENKKVLAGVLAIIFGSLGVHKFILGYNKEGFILLGFSIVAYLLSCLVIGIFFVWIPGVIGLIEGIIYLTKSDEEFYNTYQVGKKPWF
jgi:TM2 domain-containing membrane protein YozV